MGCLSTALPWCPSHEGILPSLLVIKLQLPFVCVMSAWLHSIACRDKYPGYSLQLLLWDTTELAHRDLQTETWVTNANRETLTSRHVWYHSVNWFWRNVILRVERKDNDFPMKKKLYSWCCNIQHGARYGLMHSTGFTVKPSLKLRLEVFYDHSVPGSVMELMMGDNWDGRQDSWGHTNAILCCSGQMTFQRGSVGRLTSDYTSHVIMILATVCCNIYTTVLQENQPTYSWQSQAFVWFSGSI